MKEPFWRSLTQSSRWRTVLLLLALVGLLYAFLVSIGLLGASFKLFGKGFAEQLIETSSNPIVALFGGILATTLLQSSSTTTSIVVGLVAAGSLPFTSAVYVIMGANIGTSVTNTLVSLGHITRGEEFKRAFAASTVHDFFNVMAVAILMPLQYFVHIEGQGLLGWLALKMSEAFAQVGGLHFASPIKIITKPLIDLLIDLADKRPWPLVIFSLIMMFLALRYLVVVLKIVIMARVEAFFDTVIFKNAGRAMLLGVILTVLVQSSSITTSLVVPLAGAGILTLTQIFPYTLGANIGTTITAILAALSLGVEVAVAVAFAHLLFNILGICLVWPIGAIRRIPMILAQALAEVAASHRWLAIVYVLTAFYIIPFTVILVLG